MTNKSDGVNMFEKASEDRRRKFIEDNNHVADEMFSTKPSNEVNIFLSKPKIEKNTFNYYLETRIDRFITGLGEATGNSKSEIANQLMIMCILDNPTLRKMADNDEKIKKLMDDFNK